VERLRILQLRGGAFESEHRVCAVLAGADGVVQARVGEPLVTTWRSAAKPFQLEVSSALVSPEALISARDLAVGASSHSAQPAHVEQVRALLERLGCTPDDLFCGAHWPMHLPSGHDLLRAGQVAEPLHNNCSGKHAFMAGASRHHGWPADYRDPAHPLQVRIRQRLDERTRGRVEGVVIDGCGVPCFVVSLAGMAAAYAALGRAMADGDHTALGRIGWSMSRQPWLASGSDRVDGTTMLLASRPVVAKIGAAALICLAIPHRGLGVALKVCSGDARLRAPALEAVLQRWAPGLLPADALSRWSVLYNWVGTEVGRFVAEWS